MHKIDWFEIIVVGILCLIILAQAGGDSASYNMMKQAHREVNESINAGDYTPNYTSSGKLFTVKGRTFVESEDGKIYICEDFSK